MGHVTIEESDEERSIVTPNCRLRFRRIEERWTHQIDLGAESRPFARTIEADPSRDSHRDMPSPAFQDLHLQDDGDSWLAMLVGQFGPRHFSSTFRVSPQTRSSFEVSFTTRIEVDVADRFREGARTLRLSYQILSPWSYDDRSSDACNAVWALPGPREDSAPASLSVSVEDCPGASARVEGIEPSGSRARVERPIAAEARTGRLIFSWSI